MAQSPFLTDVVQIEPGSGDTLTIERDPTDGSLLFKDALAPAGLKLTEMASFSSIDEVFLVGLSGAGAQFNTIQEALDAVLATSSLSAPSLILVGPGVYSENVSIEKDGVFLVGLGGVRLDAAIAGSTVRVVPAVTTTPLACHIEGITIANSWDGERCVEVDGTADLTLLSEGLTLVNCDVESTGTGGFTLTSTLANRITVIGGTWEKSDSTSSLSVSQTAALTLQDIAEVGDLTMSYSTLTPPIPSVFTADFRLVTLGKVGDVSANLFSLGTFDMTGCTDVGHVVVGGNKTFDFTASRIGNLTINDTATVQLLSTSLLVVSGSGTLLVWDGSSYAPPNPGGPPVGEANTASNVGTSGEGLFVSKLGVDLQFKNVDAGSPKITLTDNVGNNTVEIDVDGTQLDHTELQNRGTHTHVNIDLHIDDTTTNPHNVTAAQVGLGNVANTLNNPAAVVPPTPTDDSSGGYTIGSRWIDTVADKEYVLVDASVGAAIWVQTTLLDHTELANKGTNTHTQIDAHIADVTTNPHAVTATQVGLGNVQDLLNNYAAIVDPIVTDDSGSGYAAGSRWLNLTTGRLFVLLDASVGAAIWRTLEPVLMATAPGVGNDNTQGYFVGSRWIDTVADKEYVCLDNSTGAAVWAETTGSVLNTGANVGVGGVGVFKQAVLGTLQFKNINAGSARVTVTDDVANDEVDIDVDDSQIVHDNTSGSGTNTHAQIDTHLASTSNPHTVTAAQVGNTVAQWNADQLNSVVLDPGAPTIGKVLTATSPTDAEWLDPAPDGASSVPYLADELLDVSASDWAISAAAAAQTDTNNNSLRVRAFDDTTSEGVGFFQKISFGSNTQLTLRWSSRAETTPGVPVQVIQRLYFREMGDNTAITSWAFVDLAPIDFQTNEFFQVDVETLLFTDFTPTLQAGRLYQFELTRKTADGADTLIGDWDLLQLIVEVT